MDIAFDSLNPVYFLSCCLARPKGTVRFKTRKPLTLLFTKK